MALVGMLAPTLLVLVFMGGMQLAVERCFGWRHAPLSLRPISSAPMEPLAQQDERPAIVRHSDESAVGGLETARPGTGPAATVVAARTDDTETPRHRYDPETLREAMETKRQVAVTVVAHPREAAFTLKAKLLARGWVVHVHVCSGPNEGQRELVFVTSNAFATYVVVFAGTGLLAAAVPPQKRDVA